MSRPPIAPDVAGALTAAIPARLIKKLDATPRLAEAWQWAADRVTTDKGEVVALTVVDGVVTAVACSCLLAPKCLHVAAVVALLEPAEGAEGPEGAAGAVAATVGAVAAVEAVDGASEVTEVSADARAVAREAFRVLADVLGIGAEASGAFAQAALLRSIHACRSGGLHRLAAAQTRVLRSIRELRADRAEFSLATLTADLREALGVGHALGEGAAEAGWIGVARRDYRAIGSLRLRGVVSEAVVARSGYAGAVTYLVSDRGALYTRSDVAPGDAGRAAAAYDAAAGIGDAVLPHRELSRTGLFVSDATASPDGRLGAGQGVRAVRASEPARWDQPPLVDWFRAPLAAQLARIAARGGEPEELRPAGWDLAFVEGVLIGGPDGVGLVVGDVPVLLTTPLEQRVLAARDNLAALARATGLAVRVVGRVRVGVPRELELLAIGPADDAAAARFALPDAWHGRANVAWDKLALLPGGGVPGGSSVGPLAPAPPVEDLLAPLRRRVERAVLGGTGTLPIHALADLDREAAALAERALHGAAEVVADLAALAHDAARSDTGARRALDRTAFAYAWLRAALYEDAARRRLSIAAW